GFGVWSSEDLTDFTSEGMILRFKDLSWANKDAWAPDIIERNGRYYFYFSADSAIGVAVSDSPTGPFVDPLGKPLIPFEEDMSTIDPCVLIDDDGRTYLYWGATFDGTMFMRELNDDMISFKGEKKTVFSYQLEKDYHCEGSYVFKRGGLYYYLWSEYIWCDSPALHVDHSYRVNYAVSEHPDGPFTKELSRVPILSTDMALGYIGPGHNSILNPPGTDDYYIVYHQHQGDARYRRANIDRMTFMKNGAINTVRMTKEGVPAIPITVWLSHETRGVHSLGCEKRFTLGTKLSPDAVKTVTLFVNNIPVTESAYTETLTFTPRERGVYKVHCTLTTTDGTVYTAKALHMDVV
ncbi:MAG: family 43 glycosylhydrolase, partial [Clostridia bacterium]|nr:family 43 glycosylhydrolase [Clostridia bacterium]